MVETAENEQKNQIIVKRNPLEFILIKNKNRENISGFRRRKKNKVNECHLLEGLGREAWLWLQKRIEKYEENNSKKKENLR